MINQRVIVLIFLFFLVSTASDFQRLQNAISINLTKLNSNS